MILLLTDADNKKTLCSDLAGQGVFLLSAPTEVGNFLFLKEDIGGVVIDRRGGVHKRTAAVSEEIRRADADVPIAWIVDSEDEEVPDSVTRLRDPYLIGQILRFYQVCKGGEANRTPSGFFLSETDGMFSLLGYRLNLPEVERDLLRVLLYRYPRPTGGDRLLRFCFPESERTMQKLYTRISHINRIAGGVDGRKLILSTRDGYVLRNGIF